MPNGSRPGSSGLGRPGWPASSNKVRPPLCGASTCAAGRSQNRTSTPCSTAQTSACHSGENTANGQKAETLGSSAAYASRASGGCIPSAVTQPINGSASAGPSISTASGSVLVEGPQQRAGRPGTVVTDAEHPDRVGVRLGRGGQRLENGGGHDTSRQAS